MENLLQSCLQKGVLLPTELIDIINNSKSLTLFNTSEELSVATTGGIQNDEFEVKYEVEGQGIYTEVVVHRVKN